MRKITPKIMKQIRKDGPSSSTGLLELLLLLSKTLLSSLAPLDASTVPAPMRKLTNNVPTICHTFQTRRQSVSHQKKKKKKKKKKTVEQKDDEKDQ